MYNLPEYQKQISYNQLAIGIITTLLLLLLFAIAVENVPLTLIAFCYFVPFFISLTVNLIREYEMPIETRS